MVEKYLADQSRLSRRSWLLGAGTLIILSGTVGCLGLGDDDEEAGEPENETDGNGSEDTSTQPNGERNETTDTESLDANQSNDTGSDDAEVSEPEDNDSSILDEELNDNESDDGDENDSEGDQADLDNESDGNETQKNDTAEEAQENLDNDSTDNSSNESSDGDKNASESNQDESEGEREFEQIIIEALSYQVDYPADWEMVETDESIPVIIANSNETAWLWIDIRETSLDLEGDITNYRQNFEPNPDFEIHEDEPMTLASGEDGHRFVIEVTESPENPLFAHELLANEHGNEYLTSVQVSRPEYDEEYAELAEEILASVTLR
ncbi:hypothetical protein [Saliphagus sp. LR7]|uniref:hypothetical protein n=1 Tax=Saliphagus sp. LR7 TaxID=2282654 RepID=UPI000DF77DB5|nr:hypothetical protein [Saliphagus sp. LR7]